MVAAGSRRLLVAGALVTGGIVLLVAALLSARDGGTPRSGPRLASLPIARGWFERDVHLFGEPVTAHVEVAVAKDKIFPETLEVSATVEPYRIVGRPKRETFDLGRSLLIRYTVVLRCLQRECLPQGETENSEFEFDPFGIRWRFPPPPNTPKMYRTEQFTTQRMGGVWPPLKVTTRLMEDDLGEARWRTGIDEFPAVSYRASPTTLLAVLILLAVAMLGVAAAAIAVYVRRRVREAELQRAVAAEAERPPLEAALLAVAETRANGDGRMRMALEALADELGAAGEHELARDAQRIAWSPAEPDEQTVAQLATKVRSVVENGGRAQ